MRRVEHRCRGCDASLASYVEVYAVRHVDGRTGYVHPAHMQIAGDHGWRATGPRGRLDRLEPRRLEPGDGE